MEPGWVTAEAELAEAAGTGDGERIAEVLDRHLWPLLSSHPTRTLAMIADLHEDLIDAHASLRFGQTLGLILVGRAVRDDVAASAPLFWMIDLSEDERDNALAQQMLVARFRGEFAEAVASATRLRMRLRRPRAGERARAYDLLPLHLSQLGMTELLAGNTSQAIGDFVEARRACVADGSDPILRDAIAKAALAHAVRGTLEDAVRLLVDGQRLPEVPGALATHVRNTERLARALIAVERRDADAATLLDDVGEIAALDELWPLAALARGRHLLAEQRPGSAIELSNLCRTMHRAGPDSPAADILAAINIDAFCALDELSSADEAARSAAPGRFSRTARIRLQIRLGEFDRASSECRRIIADSASPLDHRSEALLLAAWAGLEAGAELEPGRGVAAARLATHSGLRRIFTTVPHTVLEDIARHLPPSERPGFEEAVTRLPFVAAAPPRPKITERESIVLAALARHPAVADMAEVLFVSPNTVKSQLRSLYRKLGVGNRQEALAEARRLHLLPPPGR